jgi:large subunit ribosomal protein L28
MISYMPMAMKCMSCGKGVMYGHNVSHSKRRTPRVFKPNLHSARIKTTTGFVRLKLCTKCLRSFKKIQIDEPVETPTEITSQATA